MKVKAKLKNLKSGKHPRTPSTRKKQASSSTRAVIRSLPVPVVRDVSIIQNRVSRSHIITGYEPVTTIQVVNSMVASTPLLDYNITPRHLPAPMLQSESLRYGQYRFTSLSFDMVSYFPSTAVGGIAYSVTRDIDATPTDYQQFVQSSERSITTNLSQQRVTLSVDCNQALNRFKYFDTNNVDASQMSQFRLLAVLTQPLAGITTAVPIGIQVFMRYTIEFTAPVAPHINAELMTPTTGSYVNITTAGVITGFTNVWNHGEARYASPALAPPIGSQNSLPIRIIANKNGDYTGYSTYDDYMADQNVTFDSNIVYQMTSKVYFYPTQSATSPVTFKLSASQAATQKPTSYTSKEKETALALARAAEHNPSMVRAAENLLHTFASMLVTQDPQPLLAAAGEMATTSIAGSNPNVPIENPK